MNLIEYKDLSVSQIHQDITVEKEDPLHLLKLSKVHSINTIPKTKPITHEGSIGF